MESVLGIFASIDDPRDHTAMYELPALLFMALAATLCGAKSCVDIAGTLLKATGTNWRTSSGCLAMPRPAMTPSAVCFGCSIPARKGKASVVS